MLKTSKIWIAGATGLVGSALVRQLKQQGYTNILTDRVELINQQEVVNWFALTKTEYVFLVAGKVGGIKANNTQKAEFIYNNLMIASNVVDAAYRNGVIKLLYTGSSCIYPKDCEQPMAESKLLAGPLEQTNEPYAIAKIAGIKLCEAYRNQYGCNFISAMPTNSYGPGDNYDLDNSHVLPALIRKIITAKEQGLPTVEIWGTGNAMREFIYSDDMADAMIFLMNNYNDAGIVNIGTGEEISIRNLAELIKQITGYTGDFIFTGELDGTLRKVVDCTKINQMGWNSKVSLNAGIRKTINEYEKS